MRGYVVTDGYSTKLYEPDFRADHNIWVRYDECRVRNDNRCLATLSAAFEKRFSRPGVYGIVDPLTDTLVYVGVSKNVAYRFKNHLIAHRTARDGVATILKNRFVKDLLNSGRKPGLCLLYDEADYATEAKFIGYLRPLYNVIGMWDFDSGDLRMVRRVAAWQHIRTLYAIECCEPVTPWQDLWEPLRSFTPKYEDGVERPLYFVDAPGEYSSRPVYPFCPLPKGAPGHFKS